MNDVTLHGKLFLGPYKGYHGEAVHDTEDDTFHGRIIDTKDVISFVGSSAKELQAAFKESIDDYLEFCEELGEAPEKPFSGKFVIRLTPQLHHDLSIGAAKAGKSLNQYVVDVLSASTHPFEMWTVAGVSGAPIISTAGPVSAIAFTDPQLQAASSTHRYTFDMPDVTRWDELLAMVGTPPTASQKPTTVTLGGRLREAVVDLPLAKKTG